MGLFSDKVSLEIGIEIEFGSSLREIRVSEGSSYRESTASAGEMIKLSGGV